MKKEDDNRYLLLLKWSYSYLFKRFLLTLKTGNLINLFKKIILTLLNKNKIDLDNFKIHKNLSLNKIFIKFATDKGTVRQIPNDKKKYSSYFKWINREEGLTDLINEEGHNYTPFYENHLKNLKNQQFNMLEIGVASGHSTASFYNWFERASFFCIDIKKKYKFFYKGKRIIDYSSVDLRNESKIKKYLKKFDSFDVIIEDAIHNKLGIFTSFKSFFPSLKSGGYYIIEDFKADDIANINNHDPDEPCSTEEILENFKKKLFFQSNILSKENQKKVFNEISQVDIYQGQKFDSSICFIKKK